MRSLLQNIGNMLPHYIVVATFKPGIGCFCFNKIIVDLYLGLSTWAFLSNVGFHLQPTHVDNLPKNAQFRGDFLATCTSVLFFVRCILDKNVQLDGHSD